MIRQKKILSIFMLTILILTIVTGCSTKKSAKEALVEAILNEENIMSSEFKGMLSLTIGYSSCIY